MISRDEINEKGKQFAIHPANVQRDYVVGWVLCGLYEQSALADQLVLTGGNCFRKAYFPSTRFSMDLDFSTHGVIPEDVLLREFNGICGFVESGTGVKFEPDRNNIRAKRHAEEDRQAYEIRLYFQDFYGKPGSVVISLRVDVLEFAKIYLPIQTRNLIHPYSDQAQCVAQLRCLKLEELLANKLKCLLQRVHTADLFDLVYAVFIAQELEVNRGEIVQTFLRKTIFEPAPGMARRLLLDLPFDLLREAWTKYIVCPVQTFFDFERALDLFRGGLEALFPGRTHYAGEYHFFPSHLRTPILQAGRTMTLMELEYDGVPRVVEPYALTYKRRRDGLAREYLYVYDRVGGRSGPGIKCLVHQKISSVRNTEEKFEPRYPVELSKAGEPPKQDYFGAPFGAGRSRSRRSGARETWRRSSSSWPGVVYVIECPYCSRKFKRKTNDRSLRPHQDGYGNPCYGRQGMWVDQYYE